MSDLGFFLLAMWGKWQALLTGGVLAVLVMLIERVRKKPLSWATFGTIMGIALLWSCFLAWRDEHATLIRLTNQERMETDKLNGDIGELRADLKAARTSSVEKDKRIADLQLLLDQRPKEQRLPPITIRQVLPPSTERAWLVIGGIAPDFSATPFKIDVTIGNTGQIPITSLKIASGFTTSKEALPNLSSGQMLHQLIPNGFPCRIGLTFYDVDTKLLPDIQAGKIPMFIYFKIEYYDEATTAAKPRKLETCSFWVPATKSFSQCIG